MGWMQIGIQNLIQGKKGWIRIHVDSRFCGQIGLRLMLPRFANHCFELPTFALVALYHTRSLIVGLGPWLSPTSYCNNYKEGQMVCCLKSVNRLQLWPSTYMGIPRGDFNGLAVWYFIFHWWNPSSCLVRLKSFPTVYNMPIPPLLNLAWTFGR